MTKRTRRRCRPSGRVKCRCRRDSWRCEFVMVAEPAKPKKRRTYLSALGRRIGESLVQPSESCFASVAAATVDVDFYNRGLRTRSRRNDRLKVIFSNLWISCCSVVHMLFDNSVRH